MSADRIPLTPRWDELSDRDRIEINLMINRVASGGFDRLTELEEELALTNRRLAALYTAVHGVSQ